MQHTVIIPANILLSAVRQELSMVEAATGLFLRVLGPVVAERDGVPLDLGGWQRHTALAFLIAGEGEAVSTDRLIDGLWGARPPASHRVQLQGIISDLRRRLGPAGDRSGAPILTCFDGYRLALADDGWDLGHFRRGVAVARAARAEGDVVVAIRHYRDALSWWRGNAFEGIRYPMVDQLAAAADEERSTATEELFEAQLADGRVSDLVPDLVRVTGQHPLRERLHALLMTAYTRTGRRADALRAYRDLRRRMVGELDIEPSPELQRLHHSILAHEEASPVLPSELLSEVDGLTPVSAYRQLPPDLTGFVGRSDEVAAILAVADDAGEKALALCTISGMGGTGKTRLAIHVAHRLAARYPDGQFFIDLAGPARVAPETALESVLRLLGVPGDKVPPGVPQRSAAFRDRIAGQRILIVIDGACDERQVTPLLPPGPTCMVIVTSRRALALDGSASIALDMLTAAEALSLLDIILGGGRVAAEPDEARRVAELCGHLPLAISIAAQRIRARKAWPVAYFAGRLADEGSRLDELAVGERTVRSAFGFSYGGMSPGEQLLFRRLAGNPGRDITAAAAAALVADDVSVTESMLEALLDQYLLLQTTPGRYQMHDLVRAFAFRLASTVDTPADREGSTGRLLDWYAHAADAATRVIRRFQVGVDLRLPVPKTTVPEPADGDAALRWLDAEYANLVSAMRLGFAEGWYAHTVQIGHLLQPYSIRCRPVYDWIAALRLAHSAATELGDPSALARTHAELGNAYVAAGDTRRGLYKLREAVTLHEQCGDTYGQAVARNHLGTAYRRFGHYGEAAEQYVDAYALFAQLGDPARQASTRSNLAIALHLAGQHEEAIEHAQGALELSVGEAGEAPLRTNLGLMYAQLGRHADAVRQSLAALELHRTAGSIPGEANTLANLGLSLSYLGRYGEAIQVGRRAVELARRVSMPDIEAAALNTLGEAYALAGNNRRALSRHRRALAVALLIFDVEQRDRAQTGITNAAQKGPRSCNS